MDRNNDPAQTVMQTLFDRTGREVFANFRAILAHQLPEGWSLGETVKDEWTELSNEADFSCPIVYKGQSYFELVLRLIHSYEYDGTQDGWNVKLETITMDGCIGPGFTPDNYTDKVWTRDSHDLKARLLGFVDLVSFYSASLNRDFIPHQDVGEDYAE